MKFVRDFLWNIRPSFVVSTQFVPVWCFVKCCSLVIYKKFFSLLLGMKCYLKFHCTQTDTLYCKLYSLLRATSSSGYNLFELKRVALNYHRFKLSAFWTPFIRYVSLESSTKICFFSFLFMFTSTIYFENKNIYAPQQNCKNKFRENKICAGLFL